MLIINFPKKYSVRHCVLETWEVSIPTEYREQLREILNAQGWIQKVIDQQVRFVVVISLAYEVTVEEANDALCQLCESVMSPQVELYPEVWSDL